MEPSSDAGVARAQTVSDSSMEASIQEIENALRSIQPESTCYSLPETRGLVNTASLADVDDILPMRFANMAHPPLSGAMARHQSDELPLGLPGFDDWDEDVSTSSSHRNSFDGSCSDGSRAATSPELRRFSAPTPGEHRELPVSNNERRYSCDSSGTMRASMEDAALSAMLTPANLTQDCQNSDPLAPGFVKVAGSKYAWPAELLKLDSSSWVRLTRTVLKQRLTKEQHLDLRRTRRRLKQQRYSKRWRSRSQSQD